MDPGENGKGQGNASYHRGDWPFLYLEEVQKRRTRYEPNLQNHLESRSKWLCRCFRTCQRAGQSGGSKVGTHPDGGRAGYDPWRGGLAGLCSNANDLVTSDLTHPIAGPCFLLSPDGQPVQITGDGNAEKAPTVVIMGSLNGVKLRGNPFDGAEVPLWGRSTIQKTPI